MFLIPLENIITLYSYFDERDCFFFFVLNFKPISNITVTLLLPRKIIEYIAIRRVKSRYKRRGAIGTTVPPRSQKTCTNEDLRISNPGGP